MPSKWKADMLKRSKIEKGGARTRAIYKRGVFAYVNVQADSRVLCPLVPN